MNMYPSLEDMKVDQIGQAQRRVESEVKNHLIQGMNSQQHGSNTSPYPTFQSPSAPLPYDVDPPSKDNQNASMDHLYPALTEYMGLEFTQEMIAVNMPEYLPQQSQNSHAVAVPQSRGEAGIGFAGMVAPLSGSSVGLQRAQVSHGIRQVILCKDGDGKVGLRVKAINKGVFICLVKKNSPAALVGLRFGDQILQINEVTVASFSMDKVHSLLKKCADNNISMAIRDRPFERTVTLHKDSTNHIGFQFKDAEITALVKDSSAARNGLLTEHHLLEVNGQNVVGLKDKEISAIVDECGQIVTLTLMPNFLYNHMMKHMASSLAKKMDHSIPDL